MCKEVVSGGPVIAGRHGSFKPAAKPLFFPLATALCLLAARPASAIIDVTLQMQLGNPSGATTNVSAGTNYLLTRAVEAISYNTNSGQCNWASWDYTIADGGSAQRLDNYVPDTNLPASYYKVTDGDYNGVGAIDFNRGHMCPSEDRTDTQSHNNDLFLMSNIIPQSGPQNQGVWGNLEGDCRTIANAGNEMLITCGPSGFGTRALPSGKALIASNCWKIVVIVPNGAGTALSRITTNNNRVIAVSIPNVTNGLVSTWQTYVTTAHQIELDTGLNFFTALPGPIASAFRARVDGYTSGTPPSVTGFSPASGPTNTTVTISGANFTSASAVKFNGTACTYTVNSSSQIVAIVPATATSGTISVTAPGGTGTSSTSFTISGTVTGNTSDLTVNSAHSGNFAQGDVGDTYTITVQNSGGAATAGSVSVTNILPAGLAATGISGSGWTTSLGNLTASRSDTLSAGGTYSALTITVNVSTSAPASVTNIVTVGGGSETNIANNTDTDATTVLAAAIPSATTGPATSIGTSSATLNATINPNNQPTSVWFEYGLSTSYGSTGTVSGTFTGAVAQAASASLSGLSSNTTYHFRAVAGNIIGTNNTPDATFTTSSGSVVSNFSGTLFGWDMSTVSNFGASPFPPTTNAASITVSNLTRGPGVTTSGSGSAKSWGGTGFSSTTTNAAVAAGQFITFGATAAANTTVSYSVISRFDSRRSNTGPTNGVLQFQVGGGVFTDITNLTYPTTGTALGPISLSGISALQNVGAGIPVTFRIVNYNGASGGTWYILDTTSSTAPDLAVDGIISTVAITPPATSSVVAFTLIGPGTNRLDFKGVAGDTYYVQWATNLPPSWLDLSTNTADADGLWFIIDDHATNATRFYRSVFR